MTLQEFDAKYYVTKLVRPPTVTLRMEMIATGTTTGCRDSGIDDARQWHRRRAMLAQFKVLVQQAINDLATVPE